MWRREGKGDEGDGGGNGEPGDRCVKVGGPTLKKKGREMFLEITDRSFRVFPVYSHPLLFLRCMFFIPRFFFQGSHAVNVCRPGQRVKTLNDSGSVCVRAQE